MEKFTKEEQEIVGNLLFRSHNRRMSLMYTGLNMGANTLLMGSHKEDDFKFGSPEQCIALINLSDAKECNIVNKFLKTFGINHASKEMSIIHINAAGSIANKLKWDLSSVEHREDEVTGAIYVKSELSEDEVCLGGPISSYFTMLRLREAIESMVRGFKSTNPLDVEIKESPRPLLPITITPEDCKDTELEKVVKSPVRFTISKLRDVIQTKHLLNKKIPEEHICSIRVWCPGGSEVCYAGYFEKPGYRILMGRINVFTVQTCEKDKQKNV